MEKQGYKVDLIDELIRVLTTHDAVVLIYKNECNKWVVSPLSFTNAASVVTITTVKIVANDILNEKIVHIASASNQSEPTFIELDGQTSRIYINTKCNRTNQPCNPDIGAIEQFLGHVMMPTLQDDSGSENGSKQSFFISTIFSLSTSFFK